jgi:hypothetical protein
MMFLLTTILEEEGIKLTVIRISKWTEWTDKNRKEGKKPPISYRATTRMMEHSSHLDLEAVFVYSQEEALLELPAH